jgi:hypothetical protein
MSQVIVHQIIVSNDIICFTNTYIMQLGKGTVPYDPNNTAGKNPDGTERDNSSETRIEAGVIAGVVSGGVVIVSIYQAKSPRQLTN